MSKALSALLESISLEPIDINLFRGYPWLRGMDHLYGGEIMAQAMNAAYQTVASPLRMHSLHSYFLRPGEPSLPVIYEVDRIRDGRSFTTRRVVALQRGRAIFNVSMSFQLEEAGLEHGIAMPAVPGPEGLISDRERYAALLDKRPGEAYDWPVEFRQVDAMDPGKPEAKSPQTHVWFKADGDLADDLTQHQEILAYASDTPALVTALRPHGLTQWSTGLRAASLDHCLWFHRPFRVDEWLLYALESPATGNGRGFVRGSIFSREGDLVASVVQEGLVRQSRD
ncbi:MAG TPA: acyl-CoA thioesterase II [Pseudomonadales bacterium]|jgi:acyl-CoA thioesterase-2